MKRSVVTYVHHAVVLLLLLCSLAACSHAKPGTTDEVDAATKLARETLARTLQRYSFAGQHDSVILVARPAYGDAARRHDTLMMVYRGSTWRSRTSSWATWTRCAATSTSSSR